MIKQFKLSILIVFSLILGSIPSYAMIESTTASSDITIVEKQTKELKKEMKAQKKMAKLAKFLKKSGVTFSDPVEKWFWFWIFGWGAGLLLSILIWTALPGSLWFLSSLAWLFGTVSLVIWLVKKFS